MSRLRSNFLQGTLAGSILSGATTITSTAFASLPVVASPNTLTITLDPDGVGGNPEVVSVTAHSSSSTTVTVTRGAEGTTARGHALGVTWVHAPTAADFDFTQKVTIGDGGDPNSATTQDVSLLVTSAVNNPSDVIMQHFVGYSFYTGTPSGSPGSLQGGSSESVGYNNGTGTMGTVLGFEGIGRANGDTSGQPNPPVTTVIGMLGTASAAGPTVVGDLVAIRASGPSTASGAGTVTRAKSLEVFEPTTGTTRQAIKSTGAVRLKKGTAGNTLELSNASDVLQWSSDGSKLYGYASDGTSVRATLDPGDTPTNGRFNSATFGSGKHLSLNNNGGEVVAIAAAGTITLADTVNLIVGTSTGTKIGTATTQKIGKWNATPIAQPTTAVAAATLVSNGGTALTSTDTFDGYTLLQVVKALRLAGNLA